MPLSLNNQTSRFSAENAFVLAEASKLAYARAADIAREVSTKWQMKKYFFFEDKPTDTQAFIGGNDVEAVLSFRGTQAGTFRDWMTDFDAGLLNAKKGRIHGGFKKALDTIWPKVSESVEILSRRQQTLWVTGHSLGGALSTLAVDRLLREGYPVQGMYTFGQPRTGDKTFANDFDKRFKHRSFRFINNEDIVTRVPPRLLGYCHIGCVFYFDNQGAMHRGVSSWRRFLDKLESIERRSLARYDRLKHEFPGGIDDHSIDRYILHISRYLKRQKPVTSFNDFINS